MSSRSANFNDPSAKRAKKEEASDLWGDDDDWDGDLIDDCFRKATQEINKETDVTLLSSYSVFKKTQQIITSTQCQPSTSHNGNFKEKFTELEAKFLEKEGEASILRSNLENLRTSYMVDQERKQLEWKDKLSVNEKEKKTIKSELEFKNIEILNLKQQIAELTRLVNGEQSVIQRTQLLEIKSAVSSPEKRQETVNNGNTNIYINLQTYYPLKSFNISLKTKPFQDDNFVSLEVSSKSLHDLGKTIYKDVIPLTRLSSEELNSADSNPIINKVLWSTYQLLNTFYTHLNKMIATCSSSSIKEINVQNIQSKKVKEISFLCCEIVDFIQKIIPFNAYLKECLLTEQTIFPFNNVVMETQTPHLVLLLNIVKAIKRTGQEENCNQFLCALIKLLCTMYSSEDVSDLKQNTIKEISKELVTLNLSLELIGQINNFLNVITVNSTLISFLCSKQEDLKNSNEDSCRFAKYITSLEKALTDVQDANLFRKLSENVVNLTYNTFQSKDMQQQENTCECIIKLYKLTVGTIYKNLEDFDSPLGKRESLLKTRITMLSLLIFNEYDLTQKYVADFARFKDTMYTLSYVDMGGLNLKNLEKLSASEEFPIVSREKFSGVAL